MENVFITWMKRLGWWSTDVIQKVEGTSAISNLVILYSQCNAYVFKFNIWMLKSIQKKALAFDSWHFFGVNKLFPVTGLRSNIFFHHKVVFIYYLRPILKELNIFPMAKRKLSNKELAKLFYTRDAPYSTNYTCQCGTKKFGIGSDHSNLMSHLERKHPAELQAANQGGYSSAPLTFSSILYLPKVINIHGCLCFVFHF